jgi:RHS repeat-associated protein
LRKNKYDYDPFSNLKAITTTRHINYYLFAAKRLFKSIGVYDLRSRNYSPRIGRFLQRDPKGYTDGTNLYTYAGNNPLVYTDTMGMEKVSANSKTIEEVGINSSQIARAVMGGLSQSLVKNAYERESYVRPQKKMRRGF